MAGTPSETFICHDKTNKRGGTRRNEIPLQHISINKAQSYGISIKICPSLPFNTHSIQHTRIEDINNHISSNLLCADLNDTQTARSN